MAESANNTVVTAVGVAITDANGALWTITSGAQLAVNGTTVAATSNVIGIAYVNHVVWQENAAHNWYSMGIVSGVVTTLSGPTTSPLPAATLLRAHDFATTVAVQTHLSYNAPSPYGTVANVLTALNYLNPLGIGTGIGIVREAASQVPQAKLSPLTNAGYKLDLYASYNSPQNNPSSIDITPINQIGISHVVLIEGGLEVDNQGWGLAVIGGNSYTALNGTTYTGWNAAVKMQQDLYNTFHTTNTIALWSLANPSDGASNGPGVSAAAGLGTSIPAITNWGNVHFYQHNGNSPITEMPGVIAQETGYTAGLPYAITETGFNDKPAAQGSYFGNQPTNAKYTLNLIFDAYMLGCSLISIYELMNDNQTGGTNFEDFWGLFDNNALPKQSAVALHNLFSLIGDNGATAATFATTPLSYSLTGLPANGNSLMMQRSDGAYDLVIWVDANIFSNGVTSPAPNNTVTVNLGASFGTIAVYDPMQNAAAMAGQAAFATTTPAMTPVVTASNTNTIVLTVVDHPMIVHMTGLTQPGTVPRIPAPLTGSVTITSFVNADYAVPGVTLPSGKPFHYEIMMPSQYSTNFLWPLIIYLHPDGSGNAWYLGNTSSKLSNPYGGPIYQNVGFQTKYPSIAIVPYADQTKNGAAFDSAIENWGGWVNTGGTGNGTTFNGETGPNTFGLNGLVQHLIATLSIDPSRIYIQGFSLGGIGSEYFMLRYNQVNGNPKIYTAGTSTGGVLEIHGSGAGPNAADVATMRQVPVWWISGQGDGTSVPTHWNTPMWQQLAGNSNYPALNSSAAAATAGTSQMHFWYVAGVGHSATDTGGNWMEGYPQVLDWLFAQSSTAVVTPPVVTTTRCGDFFNMICIQGHTSGGGSSNYNDAVGFPNDAASIGARHWRDGTNIATAQNNVLTGMLAKGITFVASPPYGTISPASVIASVKTFQGLGAGMVYALDGINEPELATITYNGIVGGQGNSWHAVADFTKDYYTAVKADPAISSLPVFGVSRVGAESDDSSLQFLVVPTPKPTSTYEPAGTKFGDYFNQHCYPFETQFLQGGVISSTQSIDISAGNQFLTDLHWNTVQTFNGGFSGYTDVQAKALPRVMTEFGYRTNTPTANNNDVTPAVQGKCILTGLLNAWSMGYFLVNIYEMYNASQYGIFSSVGNPKTSGIYLQNFAAILNDLTPTNRTFTPTTLNYTLAGMPAAGNAILMQKSNGDYYLVLWTYATNWNQSTAAAITVPATNVTITVPTSYPTIAVFDPTVSGTVPVSTTNGTQVTVGVRDYPMIVKLSLVASGGTGAFHCLNGKIIDPNGNVFVARGVNIYGENLSALVTAPQLFPNLNFIRVNFHSYASSASMTAGITAATNLRVVCEIEDHTSVSGGPYTGSQLASELAWYTDIATAFKNNPYVWFGCLNEPGNQSNLPAIWTQTQAIYNAIRATGNTNPVLLSLPSGGGPGKVGVNGRGFDGSGPMVASPINMTNVMWDFHYYAYGMSIDFSNYSAVTDPATIKSYLVGNAARGYGVAAAQTVLSNDGVVPVIIGEFGPSTTGNLPDDAGGKALIDAVCQTAGVNHNGFAAWYWNNVGQTSDTLTSGNSLTAYGQQVAPYIASGSPPPPTFTPSPNNTVILAGSSAVITDSVGTTWGIVGGQVAKNGVVDTTTSNVTELAYVNNVVWQENTAGNWYSNVNGIWSAPTTVSPLPTVSPSNSVIIAPTTAVLTDSAFNQWGISAGAAVTKNGNVVPTPGGAVVITPTSGGSVTDSGNHVWTLTSAGILVEDGNAIPNSGGTGAVTVSNGIMYAQDVNSGAWFTWNGTTFVAASAPPTAAGPAVVELAYVGVLIWEKDAVGNWYSITQTGTAWTGPTTTSPLSTVPGGLSYILPMKQAGLRVITYIKQESPASFTTGLASLRTEQSAHHDIFMYEGCQEPDTAVLVGTPETLAGAASFQQTVWAAGVADGLPVIQTSFGVAANYGTTGNLAAFATYGNAHTYPGVLNSAPNDGTAPGFLSSLTADAQLTSPGLPVVHSEFGWRNDHNSPTAIASYVLDFVMSAYFDLNLPYYLVNGLYDDATGQWGLFNSDQTPRLVATALDNFFALLADPAGNALSFGPGKLNVSISNLPVGTNPLMGGKFGVLQKSDGSFWLLVRNEQTLTTSDANNHTGITVAPVSCVVTLGTLPTTVDVYDPLISTVSQQHIANNSSGSFTISLPAHPILIKIVRP